MSAVILTNLQAPERFLVALLLARLAEVPGSGRVVVGISAYLGSATRGAQRSAAHPAAGSALGWHRLGPLLRRAAA